MLTHAGLQFNKSSAAGSAVLIFFCFPGTKVQILTPEARFTSTKVQILTPQALLAQRYSFFLVLLVQKYKY
jgi:hypothetical protein